MHATIASPEGAPGHASRFEELTSDRRILQALQDMGYERPTPVQARAVPALLEGEDGLVQAQTGTGKTAAFGIPLIARLADQRAVKAPRALVVCPTRELARQVSDELGQIAARTGLRLTCVYGGTEVKPHARAVRDGMDVLVGTPGRVLDLFENHGLDLQQVEFLVLDEADRLLDMGFAPDVLRLVRRTSPQRQSVLCSATLSAVYGLARQVCRKVPAEIAVETPAAADRAACYYYETLDEEKVSALIELIGHDASSPIYQVDRLLIFRHTKIGVEDLHRSLLRRGMQAEFLHGDLAQSARESVLQRFKAGRTRLLVATNVLARGLDIEDLEAVLQYDVPEDAETYIHRVGRTARAGKAGVAVLFVGPWDNESFASIRETMGGRLEQRLLPWYR